MALTAVVPLALVVTNSVPVSTAQGVHRLRARFANPGKLSYGSAGNGNITHLGAFQFAGKATGIDAVHVPYKGRRAGRRRPGGGQIQFMTETINSIMAFVKDKRVKLLAVTTPQRVPAFPTMPTLAEVGVPGGEAGAWRKPDGARRAL